ncbi:alpha/beta fold hydrolase [Roseomonas sp. AR75]|uniref:alpha/beta fold hydrolase n=1 Tax=Roseomonas sp. AR75 TaxID=2562311 RepID=UPI0010BF704F|nr:alpha/beta fold hydrolase [Roseomonas sp. AR75]
MIEAVAALPEVRLAYWDTGGAGDPVVLLHAGTGSHAVWEHQVPALTAAGHRVIAYSRRGHLGSDPGPEDRLGTGSGDLLALLDHLGVGRFHAVGTAAGGIVALDFALSCPARLRSLTLACSILGITDPDYLALGERLRPPGFAAMPPDFRELGPSYRAENPEGVARWLALEHKAIPGRQIRQPTANRITFASLRGLALPCLLMTGDADLWTPPAVLRLFARHLPRSESVVIAEAGHSAHWEQPEAFNAALLDFISRHAAA